MKTKTAALLLAALTMLTPACEQHKMEDTSKLFKSGEHGEAKGEHGEKKADEAKH